MAICVSFFTVFADRDWFGETHKRMSKMKPFFPVIPFTLPNQPISYHLSDQSEGKETNPMAAALSYPCPPFEEAFDKWITPFVP